MGMGATGNLKLTEALAAAGLAMTVLDLLDSGPPGSQGAPGPEHLLGPL